MHRAYLTAAMLLLATPASAHCYSVWKYPWPQHCGRVHVAELRLPARPAPQRVAPLMPKLPAAEDPVLDDRAKALEKLRKAMEAQEQ